MFDSMMLGGLPMRVFVFENGDKEGRTIYKWSIPSANVEDRQFKQYVKDHDMVTGINRNGVNFLICKEDDLVELALIFG